MESIVRIFNRNADRGIIGATTALFLAPKSGKELRDDLGSQASALKDKTDRMTERKRLSICQHRQGQNI